MVNYIKESLQGKAEFVPPGTKGVRLVLAVQGCSTACVDLSAFQGMEIRTITNIEGADTFIKEVKNSLRSSAD